MNMMDYSGYRFGRLTVLCYSHSKRGQSFWVCKCDCGNITTVVQGNLKSGKTKSCGCIRRENPIRIKIGNLHGTRIHKIYHNMKNRCLNQQNPRYKDYGGRGIMICNEWLGKYIGFNNFYEWAKNNGYRDDLTLDRIDNDGNYCPENCRWVDEKAQRRNTRKNNNVEIDGKIMCVKDWCELYGIKEAGVYNYSKRKNISLRDSLLRRITMLKNFNIEEKEK